MQTYGICGHEPSVLPEGTKWKLVWSDEFDGTELDRTKWGFRLNFWGKRFKPYTEDGIVLDGKSNLEIHLLEKDGHYFSAQLQTGANSFDAPCVKQDNPWGQHDIWPLGDIEKPKFMHRYGYYEVRCKFQKQPGWWSAFWLQSPSIGTAYEPTYCGIECDIIECFKNGTVTSGNIFGGYGKQFKEEARIKYELDGGPDSWHRFGVAWSEKGYRFFCDGRETARAENHVSKIEQFILLTTECQGYRSGNMDKPSDELKAAVLPDCFTVDYVRVFDAGSIDKVNAPLAESMRREAHLVDLKSAVGGGKSLGFGLRTLLGVLSGQKKAKLHPETLVLCFSDIENAPP